MILIGKKDLALLDERAREVHPTLRAADPPSAAGRRREIANSGCSQTVVHCKHGGRVMLTLGGNIVRSMKCWWIFSENLKGSGKMEWNTQIIVTLISTVVAVMSALFAWQAARAAEKAYGAELIGLLYSTYQSDEMLRDLRIVWNLYHELWRESSPIVEEGDAKANKGVLLPDDLAIKFFLNLDRDSDEFKAIHNLINFWTYIELLLKRKAVAPEEVVAFTSPRILGFLYPMAKAYAARYGRKRTKKSEILRYAYESLCERSDYFV